MLKQLAAATIVVAAIVSGVLGYVSIENRLAAVEGARLMPAGSVLAYVGNGGSTAAPNGWALCGSNEHTPDLNGRFLIGTNTAGLVGQTLGDTQGFEDSVFVTGLEFEGRYYHPPEPGEEGADNGAANNWNHKHQLSLPTVKVMYFCKQ